MGERRGTFRVVVGRREAKRQLGRPRHKWKDNIKTDLLEVGWDMDWIDLAQNRDSWRSLVNMVMKLGDSTEICMRLINRNIFDVLK